MSARLIEVHIEELVLHGFSPADRLRIGAAVQRELSRLFAEGGLPEALASGPPERDHVDAGGFEPRTPATPAAVGGAVAQSVYGGLGRLEETPS